MLEEFADLVEAGTRKLFLNIMKSEFQLGAGLHVASPLVFGFTLGTQLSISSQQESNIQIMCPDSENQVIITYQDTFILYEGPCSEPSCKVPVQSCQVSDGDIYALGNSTLMIKITSFEFSSILIIYVSCPNNKQEYKLESSGENKILFNNSEHDSVQIGRRSSFSSIKIADPSISREHIQIKFSSNWHLKCVSSTQDFFKFLHSLNSLASRQYSSPYFIENSTSFTFMQTQFSLKPL